MKKQGKFMMLIDKSLKFADEHQREIMLGGAIAGVVVTTVLSWKAGIKAEKVLNEQKAKMDELNAMDAHDKDPDEEEYKEEKKKITVETIKKMAPIVIPPALAATGTIISVIGGYKVASKQIAVLSSLYSMGEKAFSDYQEKTKELIGPKKAQEIKDEVSADKVRENPPKSDKIINTGNGETLFYDPKSGRYFYSSPEAVKSATNRINLRMMEEYYISLNEYYDEMGLTDIELGEDMGFNIDDGLIDVDHLFSVTKTEKDVPALVLEYDISAKFTEHRGKMFR